MPRPTDHKYRRLIVIAGLVVIADQITKALILHWLPLYSQIEVIPGLFNLIHVQNPGGAFGFLASQSAAVRYSVFGVAAVAAVVLVFYIYKNTPATHRWLSRALALIFGGAVGNLIDRLRFGQVVDFLDFYLGDWHWPAFNIADSGITVGIAIFIFHIVFKKMPE